MYDEITGSVNQCDPNKMMRVKEYSITKYGSFGFLFAAITKYLGFIPFSDERLLCDLSIKGKYNSALDDIFNNIVFRDGYDDYTINIEQILDCDLYAGLDGYPKLYSDNLRNMLQGFRKVDIAFMMQHKLEELLCSLIANITNSLKQNKICLA